MTPKQETVWLSLNRSEFSRLLTNVTLEDSRAKFSL